MTLASAFKPQMVQLDLPANEAILAKVQAELHDKATHDANKCFGYFPGMSANDAVDSALPACREFAGVVPQMDLAGKTLQFNFVRMSLIKQTGSSPYHLDSDAATAVTGDVSTIGSRLVWRLLLNLSDAHPRTLSYLDVNPSSLELDTGSGYIHCPDKFVTEQIVRLAVIPPRQNLHVSGVLFCASRVLHTGKDDIHGHFVAGYGYEE